jgi:hypothetical protein
MFWKRAAVVTVTALAILGLKIYQKRHFESQLRVQMLSLCANDTSCSTSVNSNLDGCFDSNYAWGGRFRKRSGLDYDKFLQCFNGESGRAYFEVESTERHNKSKIR